MRPELEQKTYTGFKLLITGAFAFAVGFTIMYALLGRKGLILYALTIIAYLSGHLFRKVFRP